MRSRSMLSGAFLISVALMLLILPLQWVGAMILAAAVHELGHYLAVCLCGGRIERFQIGLDGAVMSIRGLTPAQELLCALAGPAFGLMVLLFARWLPRTALCAGAHTLYNLLPVYPLDGGRALRCALELRLPMEKVAKIAGLVEHYFVLGAFLLGLYGCFVLHLGLMPLLLPILLGHYAKKSCKSYTH